MSVVKLDRVVTATGRIVPVAGSIFVQPYDKAIIREIRVQSSASSSLSRHPRSIPIRSRKLIRLVRTRAVLSEPCSRFQAGNCPKGDSEPFN